MIIEEKLKVMGTRIWNDITGPRKMPGTLSANYLNPQRTFHFGTDFYNKNVLWLTKTQ